jgi:D-alanyl-D-alanine carboxypeptidase
VVLGSTLVGSLGRCPAPPAAGRAPVTTERPVAGILPASDLQAALDQWVAKSRGPGGGIVRIETLDGASVWQGAAGRLFNGGPQILPSDTFEVASVTKTFVAVLALQLCEKGLVDLDAPIGRYLPVDLTRRIPAPVGVEPATAITVRQLLEHRSGLPDYWTDPPFVADRPATNEFLVAFLRDRQRFWKPLEILDFVSRLTPAARPGQRYHYTDSGYLLLGLLIEQVVARPLPAYVRATLLDPLGMKHTYWSYYERAPVSTRQSHRYEGADDLDGEVRQTAEWGGGGLVSSAQDLAIFMRALVEGRVLGAGLLQNEMCRWRHTNERGTDYGLGLFRVRLRGNLGELWGHDGHGNAFTFYWPQRRLIWTGTLNQTENNWSALVTRMAATLSHTPG